MLLNIEENFQQAFSDHKNGKLEEAYAGYKNVLSVNPKHPSALHLSGLIQFNLKNYKSAISMVETSLQYAPNDIQWLMNYGNMLTEACLFDQAICAYQKVISIDNSSIAAKIALGDLFYNLGEFNEAIKIYSKIRADNPGDISISIRYGEILTHLKKPEEAEIFFSRLIYKHPGDTELFCILAKIQIALGKYYEAADSFKHAEKLDRSCLHNAFVSYFYCTRVGEAHTIFRQVVGWIDFLWRQVFIDNNGNKYADIIIAFLEAYNLFPLAFNTLNLKKVYSQRGDLIDWSLRSKGYELDFVFPDKHSDKIKIGILALDYLVCPETYVTVPVFEYLDRNKFEISLYQLNEHFDSFPEICRVNADNLISLKGMQLADQVQIIRKDNLDILVVGGNVTAHCAQIANLAAHRLGRKQACIQTSPYTTGIKTIDFYISGSEVSVTNPADYYSERFLQIQGSGCCFNFINPIKIEAKSHKSFRSRIGVPEDSPVFISGASFNKLIPEIDEVWAKILSQVPNSYLLLYPYNPNWCYYYPKAIQWRFKKVLQNFGVDPQRAIYLNSNTTLSKSDIMRALTSSDVYLDAISYSGNISIVEALNASLPAVVLKSGPYHKNRSAAALLAEIGMQSLVVENETDYVNISVGLGNSEDLRKSYKKQIKHRMKEAPFLNSYRYGKMMEEMFLKL